jgi:hypothetical protein
MEGFELRSGEGEEGIGGGGGGGEGGGGGGVKGDGGGVGGGRGKCISYQQTSPVTWGISLGHK